MYSKVLDTGENLIAVSQANRSKFSITEFRIGEDANFNPPNNITAPVPSTVYTGNIRQIVTSVINNDTLRVSINIPETAGGFSVGNIVLYGSGPNGIKIPFGVGVADVSTPKYSTTSEYLGTSIKINLFFKYANVDETLNLTITSPQYSSLPTYGTEIELPDSKDFTYQQAYVQNYTVLARPVIVARRSTDDQLFGFPFLQRVDDPRFGWIDGGFAGDGYKPNLGEFMWGYYYLTPESAFSYPSNTGGLYTTQPNEFDDDFIADPYVTV